MSTARSVSLAVLLALMSGAFIALPNEAETIDWSEPLAIGDDLGGYSWTPSSGANSLGQMVAAWTVWLDDSTQRVFANRYIPGQGWLGPETLVEGTGIDQCAADIDDSGNCLVLWGQEQSIQSRTYSVGVGWEPVEQVTSSATARWLYDMNLAVAPDGAAMATWCESTGDAYGPFYSSYRPSGGDWMDPEALQMTSSTITNVRLANDGNGNFLVAFALYDGTRWGIWANSYEPASGWGEEVRIESQTYNAYDLNIAVNTAGQAVVVWQQLGYPDWNSPTAFANLYTPEDGWGTEVPIEELNSGGCDIPVVSMDEDGNAAAIWRRVSLDSTSASLRTNIYTAGVGWEAPTTLEGSLDSIDQHIGVGITGSETFAAWIQVSMDINTSGLSLIVNHFNITSGWEDPVTITTGNISSPCLIADNLGGAAVFWYGNDAAPYIFVSQYGQSAIPSMTVAATVDIRPDTLNLKGTEKYITAYIELPEGHDVGDILRDSIRLDGLVAAVEPYDIGDYDKDGVDDLMVKFELSQVAETKNSVPGETATMIVSGALVDGTHFEGSDEVYIVSVSRNSAIISIFGLGVSTDTALILAIVAGITASVVLLMSRRRRLLHRGEGDA